MTLPNRVPHLVQGRRSNDFIQVSLFFKEVSSDEIGPRSCARNQVRFRPSAHNDYQCVRQPQREPFTQ